MDDQTQKGLSLIRFSLLVAPVTVAVALWFVAEEGGLTPDVFQGIELYVTAVLGIVFLGVFGGLFALRSRWQAAEGFGAKRTTNIVGWALAESATLLGLGYWVLVGNALFFGVGMALQALASFVVLPLPEGESGPDAGGVKRES